MHKEIVTHTHTNIRQHLKKRKKKKGNPVIGNTDEPGTKQDKPDTEKQILYDLIFMWNLKKSNLRKQRIER